MNEQRTIKKQIAIASEQLISIQMKFGIQSPQAQEQEMKIRLLKQVLKLEEILVKDITSFKNHIQETKLETKLSDRIGEQRLIDDSLLLSIGDEQ